MSNPSPLSQRKCLLWILSLSRSLHSSFVSLLPRQSIRTPPTSFLINCTSLSSLSFPFRMLCMTSPLPSLVVVCSRLVRFRIPSGTFLLLGSIFLNISSFLLTASQVTHLFRRFRFSALCSLFTAARCMRSFLPTNTTTKPCLRKKSNLLLQPQLQPLNGLVISQNSSISL